MNQILITDKDLIDAGWKFGKDWETYYTKDKFKDLEQSFIRIDSRGYRHQINVNFRRQLVTTHRIDTPGEGQVDGYIGKFMYGTGRKRAAKVSFYVSPVEYLDDIEVHNKSYYNQKVN